MNFPAYEIDNSTLKSDRRLKSPEAAQILGIYQRVWKSRENTELVFRGVGIEVNPKTDKKTITLEQLIVFMRQVECIEPLNDNNTRFLRTAKPMAQVSSIRDIKSILENKNSVSRKQKRNRRRRARIGTKKNGRHLS